MNKEVRIRASDQYKNEDVKNAYTWFIEEIINKIWNDEKWRKPAKGGKKWPEKHDVPYIDHIISGALCSLKIIDIILKDNSINKDLFDEIHEITNNINVSREKKVNGLEFKLKRALFGYLIHDYNKITGDSYKMIDSKENLLSLVRETFGPDIQELDLDENSLYQIAFSTEQGTRFNVLRDDVNPLVGLDFEMDFSNLSDKISSKFSEEVPTGLNEWLMSLKLLKIPLFKDYYIYSIKLTENYFIAFSDLLRTVIIDYIERNGAHYLWTSGNTIYYLSKDKIKLDIKELKDDILDKIGTIISIEKQINFTDRRVNIPGRQIFPLTHEVFQRVAEDPDKLMQALRPSNSEIDENDIPGLKRYKELIESKFKDFSVNLSNPRGKPLNYRDVLILRDNYLEEIENAWKVILVRIVQLEATRVNKGEIKKVKDKISNLLQSEEFSDIITFILRKTKDVNKTKNPLIAPIIASDEGIDWNKLENELIKILTKDKEQDTLFNVIEEMILIVLNPLEISLPYVPNKDSMSMIDGYPANVEAIEQNLYGLRTNATFTNRVKTSVIGNANVDLKYVLESTLRKEVEWKISPSSKSEGTVFVFLDFPGPLPFLDIDRLTGVLKSNDRIRNIRDLYIALNEENYGTPRIRGDVSYFIPRDQPSDTAEAFNLFLETLSLVSLTNLKIQVIDSHAPPSHQQKEIFRYVVNAYGMANFGIYSVRYDEINDVLQVLEFLRDIANKSRGSRNLNKVLKEIVIEFSRNPLSLFTYVLKIISTSRPTKNVPKDKSFIYNKIGLLENIAENGIGGIKGVVNIKRLKELAEVSRKLREPDWKMSASQRTWMLRESLELLEKAISTLGNEKPNLHEYEELLEGHIYKGLTRENDPTKGKHIRIDPNLIKEFVKKLIEIIEVDFSNRLPSGSMKSYFIDAYEFEYMFSGDS